MIIRLALFRWFHSSVSANLSFLVTFLGLSVFLYSINLLFINMPATQAWASRFSLVVKLYTALSDVWSRELSWGDHLVKATGLRVLRVSGSALVASLPLY